MRGQCEAQGQDFGHKKQGENELALVDEVTQGSG